MTRVNTGKQDIQGYTRYTVLLGYSWVHRIYMGTYIYIYIYRGIQGIQYY